MNFKIFTIVFLSLFLESIDFRFSYVVKPGVHSKQELSLISENSKLNKITNYLLFYRSPIESKQALNPEHQNIASNTSRVLLLSIVLLTVFLTYYIRKKKRGNDSKIKPKSNLIETILIQEINRTDSIHETQEKERNKYTDDLFDNLGSKVATIRNFIDAIKSEDGNSEEKRQLLKKLEFVTDVTYKDVQKIEKLKNTSVPISGRLIPSLKKLANQISQSGSLKVKILDFRDTIKIKFRIELEIYRIIQDLLLNFVRSAQATFVSISFSLDENILNIIIEDNSINRIIYKRDQDSDISEIEKRLENIGGNINIASRVKIGNSTIINIPL